jgi:hypothetical protein
LNKNGKQETFGRFGYLRPIKEERLTSLEDVLVEEEKLRNYFDVFALEKTEDRWTPLTLGKEESS